ncbi:hypothetical protein [Arthrobacter sp. 35W]|uniref:aggregation-promoting factor C-terminal-like domain-containing protein n=1 Tax=Arthrobacter sp. 35W TaxID=1132441 RepID=UPI0004104444|nr:hypothetical protein [Arthrobacter sp. 35W]
MSTKPHHGRRRALPARKQSLASQLWAAAPKPTAAGQRMAVVAVAGALLVGMGAATSPSGQASASPARASSTTPLDASAVSADGADADITAAADAPLAFARPTVGSSSENTTNVPALKGVSDAVAPLGANGGAINDPAGAKAYAASQMAAFGWGQDQMSCLVPLWQRESDWTTTAENPSSLSYGIVQALPASKMDSAGTDWRTNYQTQIRWGLGYIKDRYGNPCGAWAHSESVNWY